MMMLDLMSGSDDNDPACRVNRLLDQGTRGNAVFHARLGADLYRYGHYPEAVLEYRQALALAPGNADLHNHLGIALCAQGLHEEAIAELRRAVAINPADADASRNLELTLHALGRDELDLDHSSVSLSLVN